MYCVGHVGEKTDLDSVVNHSLVLYAEVLPRCPVLASAVGAALEEAAIFARSWAGVTARACSGLSLDVVSSLWPAFVTTLKGVAGVILFMPLGCQ